jgi:DNA repair exonuclease SbcCD ATPase subunit
MIAYQTEVQDQIVAFEETETCFDVQLLQVKQKLTDKEEEMKQLKIDLELKSRLEQEKLENVLQTAEQKSESHANQLEQVMSQLAQGDENHNSSLAAFKKKSTDLEKEILELKNRETSLKSNEQQMIAYQKELQDQIGAFEETESRFERQLEQTKQRLTDKEDEIKQLAIDIELKSRYEQEKEISNKELQMQSIEYQKKLQDQLEQAKTENDTLLRETDSLAKQLNDKVQEALKETETLRSQLNETKVRIKKFNFIIIFRYLAFFETFGGIIRKSGTYFFRQIAMGQF